MGMHGIERGHVDLRCGFRRVEESHVVGHSKRVGADDDRDHGDIRSTGGFECCATEGAQSPVRGSRSFGEGHDAKGSRESVDCVLDDPFGTDRVSVRLEVTRADEEPLHPAKAEEGRFDRRRHVRHTTDHGGRVKPSGVVRDDDARTFGKLFEIEFLQVVLGSR
jgi:hypothetical protein